MADKYTPERATSGKEWLRTWWKKVENNFTKIFGAVNKHIDGTTDRHTADMIDYSDTETVRAKLDSTDTKLDSTDTKLDTKVDKVSGKSLIDENVAVLLDTDGNGALEIYPDCGGPTMRGSTKVKIDSEGACVRVVTGETRIGYDGITVGHENSLDSHGDVTVYETVMGETSATFKTHKLSEKANSADLDAKLDTAIGIHTSTEKITVAADTENVGNFFNTVITPGDVQITFGGSHISLRDIQNKVDKSELNTKVDKIEGKSLINTNVANKFSEEITIPNGVKLDGNLLINNTVAATSEVATYKYGQEPNEYIFTHKLSEKANSSDVLEKTNTTEFTPTADYQPATKKYVDDAIKAAIEKYNTEAMALLGED